MKKRSGQKNAALTNNKTPKESLPEGEGLYNRSKHNRPKEGPGSKG
ncbi:hypothetical protein GH741_08015 [Aquibacillus halophilus]|uniref:Uncharacterized protein n=1 Tax=Aquibacillus halophilus TaxID=930132 RepID=A0A6A8DFK1_9BACI|nr:hypothetical protein [Aquibacillus halophilus]MRH42629.1 hypothetical protein [Aquibacillus halophilus]